MRWCVAICFDYVHECEQPKRQECSWSFPFNHCVIVMPFARRQSVRRSMVDMPSWICKITKIKNQNHNSNQNNIAQIAAASANLTWLCKDWQYAKSNLNKQYFPICVHPSVLESFFHFLFLGGRQHRFLLSIFILFSGRVPFSISTFLLLFICCCGCGVGCCLAMWSLANSRS